MSRIVHWGNWLLELRGQEGGGGDLETYMKEPSFLVLAKTLLLCYPNLIHTLSSPNCRIAKLDKRIGNSTILASNKWQAIFAECESALGFSGDAANDVLSAWTKLASDSFQKRIDKQLDSPTKGRRSQSLNRAHGKSVLLPMELIPLDRARALTLGPKAQYPVGERNWEVELAYVLNTGMKTALSRSSDTIHEIVGTAPPAETDCRPVISGPLNLEESISLAYPSSPGGTPRTSSIYAPQADRTSPVTGRPYSDPEESVDFAGLGLSAQGSFDTRLAIQRYVDQVSFMLQTLPLFHEIPK